jgi:hypothetical protein
MTIRKAYVGGVLCVALAGAGVLFGQRPAADIDAQKFPNLAEAQRYVRQAYEKAEAAQQAHKDKLGDHAQKAKEHLEAADRELKAAADYASRER